jgi:beta-glucosidase
VARVIATREHFADILARTPPDRGVLACADHRALAREAAAKSVVLLRNETVGNGPVLPLDPNGSGPVALLGRLASTVNLGDGGSSDVWAPEVVTIEEGLRAGFGPAVVTDDGADLQRAAEVARAADVAIVVVGYTRLDEGEFIGEFATAHLAHLFPGDDDPALVERFEASIADERAVQPPDYAAAEAESGGFAEGGDRRSLRLHDHDVALIGAVAAANPRTVVAIVAGSAVVISEWDDQVPAVVQAWYSGMEGGHGLADVLLGRVDATGRLPFSVPRSDSDLPAFEPDAQNFTYDDGHGYWYLARNGTPPAYPFGFGLSYTDFVLEETGVEAGVDGVSVAVAVRNTGDRPGSDVVQVYASRRGSGRPERLVAFGRIELEPGLTGRMTLKVAYGSLAVRDVSTHTMVTRSGVYDLRVARHAADPGIAGTVELAADRSAG